MKIKNLILGSALLLSNAAYADYIVFHDRGDFENYLSTFIVDDLETVGNDHISSKQVSSGDFSWTMSDYNCENGNGCSISEDRNGPMMDSPEDDFVWTYGNGVFNFNQAIYAFGIQFGSHYGATYISLNGVNSGYKNSGSFFGIVSEENAFSSVSYAKSHEYGSFDDVTYSYSSPNDAQVNLPATGLILLSSLGLMGMRRKVSVG